MARHSMNWFVLVKCPLSRFRWQAISVIIPDVHIVTFWASPLDANIRIVLSLFAYTVPHPGDSIRYVVTTKGRLAGPSQESPGGQFYVRPSPTLTSWSHDTFVKVNSALPFMKACGRSDQSSANNLARGTPWPVGENLHSQEIFTCNYQTT